MHIQAHLGYHHGENNGSFRGLDDPEEDQAAELDDSKKMDLPQRDVTKVNEVWLMFGRHAKQPQTVKELHRYKEKMRIFLQSFSGLFVPKENTMVML